MGIGLIIVGDEILSGRRVDVHLPKLVEMLNQRGLQLNWSRIIGDDPELLESTFKDTFASNDIVFSTGGIGGTPDDLTRECAANALGSQVERHPEGIKIIEARAKEMQRELTPLHYRMIEFPAGATLIPNPINNIPGFSLKQHHFVPGFPEMAWPMMEWVLDNLYADTINAQYIEKAVMVYEQYESAVIPLMEDLLRRHSTIKVFCLPIINKDTPRIELGIKGDAATVNIAMEEMLQQLNALQARWEAID